MPNPRGSRRAAASAVDRSRVPRLDVLRARKRMNDAVRAHFDARGLLEVETPIAVVSPGLEPHLEAFETEELGPDRSAMQLYLHTSPEYAMKRLLGRGTGSIYQLARVFRNGERSRTHAPEFTLLEWYRSPGDMWTVMADAEALVEAVADAVGGPWRPQAPPLRLSVSAAFERVGLPDPLEHPGLDDFRDRLGARAVPEDDWDDLFFRALLDSVEPSFPDDRITILYGYPASMAALARLDSADPRRAERFELYIGTLELGNAFSELVDPVEQRRRFDADQAVRRGLGRPVYPIDEGLLDDLAAIDSAGGMALGLDRLLMQCLGLPAVQDTLIFSPRDFDD